MRLRACVPRCLWACGHMYLLHHFALEFACCRRASFNLSIVMPSQILQDGSARSHCEGLSALAQLNVRIPGRDCVCFVMFLASPVCAHSAENHRGVDLSSFSATAAGDLFTAALVRRKQRSLRLGHCTRSRTPSHSSRPSLHLGLTCSQPRPPHLAIASKTMRNSPRGSKPR